MVLVRPLERVLHGQHKKNMSISVQYAQYT
jgi:hypothetical protein